MTSDTDVMNARARAEKRSSGLGDRAHFVALAIGVVLIVTIYWMPAIDMYRNWNSPDSYYSHGFLIPLVSLALVWTNRRALLDAPQGSSVWGIPVLIASGIVMLLSDYLGFAVFGQLSFVSTIVGMSLIFLGVERTRAIWFPIAFLVAMIPLPGSLTQGAALNLKLFAASQAVHLAQFLGFPMVQDGSYIHFNDDYLLVGDVCGGLRSLIALLAIGVLMAYFSRTRPWARILVLAMSGPIAIAANVFRIFILCVVGYYQGSEFAAGRFHDISGVFIFAFAFVLFFTLEGLLRKFAPEKTSGDSVA